MVDQILAQTQEQRLQMVLAPQLRQSLEFLQVPILELQTLVQQELEQNPTLEEEIPDNIQVEVEPGATGEAQETDERETAFKEEYEILARLDDEWREYFQQHAAGRRFSSEEAARRQYFLDSIQQPKSLQEHLLDQLALAGLDREERQMGELIIGSINDEGFLTTPLEEITDTTGFDVLDLEHVLSLVQEFDPIGVGARGLSECLLLQLRRVGKEDSLAASVVRDHLGALGGKKFNNIARALKVPVEEVHAAARFIATLEPRPGRMFTPDAATYVTPEVVVEHVDGQYLVIQNNDQVPHLRISNHYRRLMEDATTTPEVKNYVKDKIRAGAFLIKSIGQRQQTINRIANEIVLVQREFLEHGVSHLKPLTMAEVAAVLDIHETTVSRAIANKYMQTPRGMFEMKYFFTPGLKTTDGHEVSNKTIKDAIAQLVEAEDPGTPLSDQAMVEKLKEQGIQVARRTVAKYRDELKILPSHLRKSF